jgi:hypothetical protein
MVGTESFRQFGEPTLIDAEKHPRSPQLSCRDHQSAPLARPEPKLEIIPAS